MTKTICDICGKDMPVNIIGEPIKNLNFCISSYGKIWDICNKCRNELNEWIKEHKAEREDKKNE